MNNGVYVGLPTSNKEIKFDTYKANDRSENAISLGVTGQGRGFYNKQMLLKTIQECNKGIVVIDPEADRK
ncbi:MAG: hypothetical protein AB2421_12885 [Thermotaleaceae bacterium]